MVRQDVSRGGALCLSARDILLGYSSPGASDTYVTTDTRLSNVLAYRARKKYWSTVRAIVHGPKTTYKRDCHRGISRFFAPFARGGSLKIANMDEISMISGHILHKSFGNPYCVYTIPTHHTRSTTTRRGKMVKMKSAQIRFLATLPCPQHHGMSGKRFWAPDNPYL